MLITEYVKVLPRTGTHLISSLPYVRGRIQGCQRKRVGSNSRPNPGTVTVRLYTADNSIDSDTSRRAWVACRCRRIGKARQAFSFAYRKRARKQSENITGCGLPPQPCLSAAACLGQRVINAHRRVTGKMRLSVAIYSLNSARRKYFILLTSRRVVRRSAQSRLHALR